MPWVIALAILLTIVGLVGMYSGRARYEGTHRRGAGWYLQVGSRPDFSPGPSPPVLSSSRLVASTAAGVGLVALAVITWVVLDFPGALPVVLGLLGVALVGMAVERWRANRWLRDEVGGPGEAA
jgi:hypothetical protein